MPDPTGPLPCHWYENPDWPGERFMVPCCFERLTDPDAKCTCELPVSELVRLRREIAERTARATRAVRELRALEMALIGRPDCEEVFAKARTLREHRTSGR